MIILHCYVPGVREDDQAKCWGALVPVRERWPVVDIELPRSELAYAQALRRWWGIDTLVNIEHDVAPSVEAVEALGMCPQPLCTRPPGGAPAQDAGQVCWLGCTKIALGVQQLVPWAPILRPWDKLDVDLTATLQQASGAFWHVHREPLEHYHHA